MPNDQDESPLAMPSVRSFGKGRPNSIKNMDRMQRIRDRKTIYPESTLNKIVYISNISGNGFRRQNLQLYNVPAHINLQRIINGINQACFNQWRISFEALEAEPLLKYGQFLSLIQILVIIAIIVVFYFFFKNDFTVAQHFAYTLLGFVGIGCIYSLFLIKQKRVDINKDVDMIRAIKKELMRLNSEEERNFKKSPRFKWKCHKDCLWISCQFY